MRKLTDRWILPLRDDSVVDIGWGPEHVHLILDSQASIVVGYGTHLTPGNGSALDRDAKPLADWERSVAEEALRGRIVSSVGFKSGTLRVWFANGWGLISRLHYANTAAAVYLQDDLLWIQTESGGSVGGGVGISIAVQNQIHELVRSFHGPVATTLAEMALEAPTGTMLGEIHAYADTMFNSYQLTLLLDELSSTVTRNEREDEVVHVLREAARDAIDRHGYLWFSGD